MSETTDLAPAYAPFFGTMGAAAAIIFSCKYLFIFMNQGVLYVDYAL